MPNFAIFGGTFNPVHWGHLWLAATAFEQFRLDRVIWVPTFRPAYKAPPAVAFEHRLAMICRAIAAHPGFTVSTVSRQQPDTSYAIDTLHALQTLEPDACWYWLIGNDAFQSLPKWKASRELMPQCIWLVAPRGEDEGMGGWGDGGMRGWGDGEMGRWGTGGHSQADAHKSNGSGAHEAVEATPPHPHTPTPSPSHAPSPSHIPTPPHSSLHWYSLQMPAVAISSSLIRQRCREGRSIRSFVPETVYCYILEQDLYRIG